MIRFLTRTRDGGRPGWADWFSYLYLALGVVMMLGPVVWLVLSSFKSQADLVRYPPGFLPQAQRTAIVAGQSQPLPLFRVTLPDGTEKVMAQFRRIGLEAQMIDPENPGPPVRVKVDDRQPIEELHFELANYLTPLESYNFVGYFKNSLVVTVAATLITLLVNSMAAFALSKYRFRGSTALFLVMLGTLMIPVTVILVPAYLVIAKLGLLNSLWGVILPGAATPTGVFLLRQYMLTIPDELIEAARMDAASEWRVYWRIVLPLSAPALAVLGIFSVVWRWNDFLWPLVVLSRSDVFTLQVGLNAFQGELNTQWHYVLAMTVLTLLPVTLVFAFLQRFITTGIASSGMK